MKKITLFIVLTIATQFVIAQTPSNEKQTKENTYKVDIPLGNFQMRLAKDSSLFTQKDLKHRKPTILMLFSPTCGHCQHQTRILEENIDAFKDAQIVMLTWLSFDKVKTFYTNFHIADYSNITCGADAGNRKLLTTYRVSMYPKLIIYDKKGNYVTDFNGDYNIDSVKEAFAKLK